MKLSDFDHIGISPNPFDSLDGNSCSRRTQNSLMYCRITAIDSENAVAVYVVVEIVAISSCSQNHGL